MRVTIYDGINSHDKSCGVNIATDFSWGLVVTRNSMRGQDNYLEGKWRIVGEVLINKGVVTIVED